MVVQRAKTQRDRGLVALPTPAKIVVGEARLLERGDLLRGKHQDGALLEERALGQIDRREDASTARARFANFDRSIRRDGVAHRYKLRRKGDVTTPQSEVGNGFPAASPTSAEGRRGGVRRLAKTRSQTSVNPP